MKGQSVLVLGAPGVWVWGTLVGPELPDPGPWACLYSGCWVCEPWGQGHGPACENLSRERRTEQTEQLPQPNDDSKYLGK